MCLSPAAEGRWCARVLQRPAASEAARVQQLRAARVTGLCALGVAHNDVPAKNRAPQVSGLVYGQREATT